MTAWRVVAAGCMLVLVTACTKSAPAPLPAEPAETRPPAGAETSALAPRLVVSLPLGDGAGQPGRSPGRVGGVSPAGPRSLAVGSRGELYVLDQAHQQLLQYAPDGRFFRALALPWMGEWSDGLYFDGERFYLRSDQFEYMVHTDGRILALRNMNQPGTTTLYPTERTGSGYVAPGSVLGRQPGGYLVQRSTGRDGQTVIRRTDGEGREADRAAEPREGDLVDFHVGLNGAVYTLTWVWENQSIGRVLVHEVLPPLKAQPPGSPGSPAPKPVAFGLPVPQSLQVALPDWRPFTLTDPVDLHNLWMLLSQAQPIDFTPGATDLKPAQLVLEGGRAVRLLPDRAELDGRLFQLLGTPMRMVQALGFSPDAVRQALATADVTLVLSDLPGRDRTLTTAERKQLLNTLTGAVPAAPHSTPQPLETPFPRYVLRLKSQDWQGAMTLKGGQHLVLGNGQGVALRSDIGEVVRSWLPVPDLKANDPAYLYRAEKLEFAGQDMSRWKTTVVRYLTGVYPARSDEAPYPGPQTFIFTVAGARHEVVVDEKGFTYAGRRFERAGLLHLAGLAGVP